VPKKPDSTTKGGRSAGVPAQSSPTSFEAWAIVEIFGHQKYAGKVSEFAIGGCNFVRVDVPELAAHPSRKQDGASPAFSKLFGNGAIYSITLVSEAVARAVAEQIRPEPLNVYIPIIPDRQLRSGEEEDFQ
jgi:hypothetical protein